MRTCQDNEEHGEVHGGHDENPLLIGGILDSPHIVRIGKFIVERTLLVVLGCGGRHCENRETDAGSLRLWLLRDYLIV